MRVDRHHRRHAGLADDGAAESFADGAVPTKGAFLIKPTDFSQNSMRSPAGVGCPLGL